MNSKICKKEILVIFDKDFRMARLITKWSPYSEPNYSYEERSLCNFLANSAVFIFTKASIVLCVDNTFNKSNVQIQTILKISHVYFHTKIKGLNRMNGKLD